MNNYEVGQKLKSKTDSDYIIEITSKMITCDRYWYFAKSNNNKNGLFFTNKKLDEEFEVVN